MNLIVDEEPDYVVVFGADNIYRMDVEQMLDAHIDGGLGCTVAGIRVPRSQATAFGVIDAGGGQQDQGVPGEAGRPARPAGRSGRVVRLDGQLHLLHRGADRGADSDAEDDDSRHDMGGDIIPSFVNRGEGQVYDFTAQQVPGSTDRDKAYWRDVGTIDAYHEAHMDLVSVDPVFNLYNEDWPIWTYPVQMPGAKFTLRGLALDSIVSPGCIISGGSIETRCSRRTSGSSRARRSTTR